MLVVISVSHGQQEKESKLMKSFQFTRTYHALSPRRVSVSVINITDPGKKGRGNILQLRATGTAQQDKILAVF